MFTRTIMTIAQHALEHRLEIVKLDTESHPRPEITVDMTSHSGSVLRLYVAREIGGTRWGVQIVRGSTQYGRNTHLASSGWQSDACSAVAHAFIALRGHEF